MFYVCECFAHVYVLRYAYLVSTESRKEYQISKKLELQMAINHHVGAKFQIRAQGRTSVL